MPVMNFDLEDGLPFVVFTLKLEDTKRFMDFMAECNGALKDAERYRVLRDPAYQMLEDDPCVTDDSFNTFFEGDLDKVVDALKARRDAAMSAEVTK